MSWKIKYGWMIPFLIVAFCILVFVFGNQRVEEPALTQEEQELHGRFIQHDLYHASEGALVEMKDGSVSVVSRSVHPVIWAKDPLLGSPYILYDFRYGADYAAMLQEIVGVYNPGTEEWNEAARKFLESM